VIAARDQQHRWSKTVRSCAITLAVGMAVGGIALGISNRTALSDLSDANDVRSSKRTQQEACAQRVNAEWSANFGQAAVSPVGSQERAFWAAKALQVRPRLENIDQECFGVQATTTTMVAGTSTAVPTTTR
jgi:hypothetical protein